MCRRVLISSSVINIKTWVNKSQIKTSRSRVKTCIKTTSSTWDPMRTSDLFQSRTSRELLDNNHIWFYELQIIQSPGVNTHRSSIRLWGPAGCSLLNGRDRLITELRIRSCREVWTDEREEVRLSNLQFTDVMEEFLPLKWEVVSSHDGLIWWKCSQLESVK